jgi:hypothetical protein
MVKWLVFIVLFCVSAESFAQKNKVFVYELDQINGLYYQRNTIDPFTGTAISFCPTKA